MNKLAGLAQWLWIELQLSSSSSVQDKAIPWLHKAKDTARLLLRPFLTIYQWRGHNESGPLTVSYAGLGYAAPFIKDILFVEKPLVTEVKRVPVWRPGELANSLTGDITIVEAHKRLIQELPAKNAVILPFQVGFTLNVQGSWEELKRRFHRHLHKNELRYVRKYGYEYSVSHELQDLDMFYHHMYLPTLTGRYSNLADPMSAQEAHQYFQHGMLFLVKRDGQCTSAALCSTNTDALALKSLGVMNADEQLMKEGAQGVAWYAMIHWANKEGYRNIDFGGCWPFIEGVFSYKRKWGSALNISPRNANKRIWIKIQRDTPAVNRFLKENPCVIIDRVGELRVLIVTDEPGPVTLETEAYWQKQYAMPGLGGLRISSLADFVNN
jgi:hypothetical protein